MQLKIHSTNPFWQSTQAPALKAEKTRRGTLTRLAARVNPDELVIVDGTLKHHSAFWRKVEAGAFKGDTTEGNLPKRAHVITLGDFRHISKPGLSPSALRAFGRALVAHEVQHGLRTLTPLADIVSKLRAEGIPFRLFNLAEDIRIEAAERNASGKKWGWQRWVRVDRRTWEPAQWLQSLRLTDGRRSARWAGSATTAQGHRMLDRLEWYWQQFRLAESDVALIPLLIEWRKDFPAAPAPKGPLTSGCIGGEKDASDPAPSDEGAGDPEATPVAAADPKAGGSGAGKEQDKPMRTSEQAKVPSLFLAERGEGYLPQVVRSLEQALAGIIESADEERSELGMSGRLMGHRAAAGERSAFLRREEADGKRRVLLLVDCSGSMKALVMPKFAHPLMAAMHGLHKRGMLNVDIVLTGAGQHFLFAPTSAEDCYRVKAFAGSETVRDTLIAIDKRVQAADVVAVVTDGCLTDGFVNAGEWRARGVDLIGVCCCESENKVVHRRTQLTKHFRAALVSTNSESLAKQLVRYAVKQAKE